MKDLSKKKKKRKLAVSYLRVSTDNQELDRQRTVIKEYSKSRGFKILYFFEEKISGSKTKVENRNEFVRMEDYLDNNKDGVSDVFVAEISRIGRGKADVAKVIERFTEKKINIHFKDLELSTLKTNYKPSFSTDLLVSFLTVTSFNEIRLLKERIKSGKYDKIKKGLSFNSKLIGYKRNIKGKPVVDKKQAEIVKKVFELASKGEGMRSISEIIKGELNYDIPSGTISTMLKNPFYKGERTKKNRNIKLPKLVDEKIWEKANKSVKKRSKYISGREVHTNLFSGKIECGICNEKMYQIVIEKGRNNLFRCKNPRCKNSVNRPWLYDITKLTLKKYIENTKQEEVREEIKREAENLKIKISGYKKDIEDFEKQLDTITLKFAQGKVPDKSYMNVVDKINVKMDFKKSKLTQSNTKLIELINALNKEEIFFSEELSVLKKQINDILKSVRVFKNEVELNFFALSINIKKARGADIFWLRKKTIEEQLKVFNRSIQDGFVLNIDDIENLQSMVDGYFLSNEMIDDYFSSQEYNRKVKGVNSLGGKK